MITVKKGGKMNIDIWEANLCKDKSYAQGSIPGTLEDPDEDNRVHPVGYGHQKKKGGVQ